MKKLRVLMVSLLLAIMTFMMAGNSLVVFAEKPESQMTEEEKAAKEAREKLLQDTFDIPVQTNALTNWPQGTGTFGEAAIVMDAETGAILYAKDIEKTEYPASITKVLTALIALEDISDMNGNVTVSAEALECLGGGYSSIGLKPGNVITFDQAMHAMLLASANEAAYAVGENVAIAQGQNYDWFLQRMNERTKELGGTNSNFVNTNGVFDEQHTTCARDMALIGKELFKHPHFFEICQTPQYMIPASDTVEEHVFQQHHHMLLEGNDDYFDLVIGGKTGYTTEAENTLITMADNGSLKLVCVVLKTYSGHPYPDTRALLDYGFANFHKTRILDNDKCYGYTLVDEDACVTLPDGVSFEQLEKKTETDESDSEKGVLSYYYEGNLVGSCDVEFSKSVQIQKMVTDVVQPEENTSVDAEKFGIVLMGAIVIIFILSLILTVIVEKILQSREEE